MHKFQSAISVKNTIPSHFKIQRVNRKWRWQPSKICCDHTQESINRLYLIFYQAFVLPCCILKPVKNGKLTGCFRIHHNIGVVSRNPHNVASRHHVDRE